MFRAYHLLALFVLAAFLLNPHIVNADTRLQPDKANLQQTWTSDETTLVLGVLTGAAVFSLLDESIYRQLQNNRSASGNDVAAFASDIGHPAALLGISGVMWGMGTFKEDVMLADTGSLAMKAVILSQIGCVLTKVASGRNRSTTSEDAFSFEPFSLDDENHSLPSGHTAGAFALASVFSQRSTSSAAPYGYYGLATMVGLSRIYQDEHWTSDVIVGALVGELAARLTVNRHQEKLASIAVFPFGGMVSG